MPDRRGLDTPVLTVDKRPLAAELYPRLRMARVEESVQLPDRFTLRFDDPQFTLFDAGTFTLGTSVQVAFRTEADPLVVTEGEVVSLSVEPGSAGHHELVIVGLDRGHRLGRRSRTRTFANMSDAAIANQVASEYGLDADVQLQGESHEYVMQAAQTDWAFLRNRTGRTGHDLWISGTTLHVAPHPTGDGSPPTLKYGVGLHHFSIRFTAVDRCDEVVVHGWDPVGKRALRGSATAGDTGSDAPAVDQLSSAARRTFGHEQRETGRRSVGTAAEADAMARAMMDQASGSEVVLRGEAVGDPRLGAGSSVRLEGIGAGLSGSYRLTSVEHYYASGSPYVTKFVSGNKDPAGLADLLGAGSTSAASPIVGSTLVVGTVTNSDDPSNLSRVRVRFPTLSQDDESGWARLAVPGGGASRGMQWLPEVGDEVLVGFEAGDVHRPVVLGGLWNRTDTPPEPTPGSGGATKMRVLATRKNSRLEMYDDTTSHVSLTMGDAGSALTLTKSDTTLNGDQAVHVTGDTIEVKATTKLTLSAPQIEISATGSLTVKGQPIQLN
ncbi:VgrG-related protein [Acidothermaceae bacterium B102]|nr:VgrG-related protein [Acidothermaceae bacterium B102]